MAIIRAQVGMDYNKIFVRESAFLNVKTNLCHKALNTAITPNLALGAIIVKQLKNQP